MDCTPHTSLASSIALHQSFGVITGTATPALSDHVIDTIMTSLQRMAASVTQPVVQPTPHRISSVLYPTTAVVAATLVIASRRKHQQHPQGNLQFTENLQTRRRKGAGIV
jgi:hypothetical protein